MCRDSEKNTSMAPNVTSGPVATQQAPQVNGLSLSPVQAQITPNGYCQQMHVPTTQALSLSTGTLTPEGLTVFAPQGMHVPGTLPYLQSPPLSASPPQILPAEMSPSYLMNGYQAPQTFLQQIPTGEYVQVVVPMGMNGLTHAPSAMMHPQQQQQQQHQQQQQPPQQLPENYHCSQKMEVVWHSEFTRLFQGLPTSWQLMPTLDQPSMSTPGINWHKFQDSAKVRFCCSKCGKGWTSMKGRVVFWFAVDENTNAGLVMFKLYGQVCERCKDGLEYAMWYPEEVVKVVNNIYSKVGQVFYGIQQPKLRIDRRVGKPRSQHNSQLCQACQDGMCMGGSRPEVLKE